MHTSPRGLQLIEEFEGFVPYAYRDPVGVLTIGYGTTSADISPLPLRCTQAQAEGWLRTMLAHKYEPAVVGVGVPLNQNQFDALVSLAYNCGPGVMGWQIGRDLAARRYDAVAADFLRYIYAGGRILPGLVNRRRAERTLFLTPIAPQPPVNPPPPPPAPHRAKGKFGCTVEYDHDARTVHVVGTHGEVESWGAVNETIHLQIDLPVGPKPGMGVWPEGKVLGSTPR